MPLNKVNYVDGQTIISAQNMNDIQDEVIRLGEKEAIQSDWLEKDENSLAYVKNKPFGPVGQYQVICITEEAATSNKLIEITAGYNNQNNTYYLYDVTPNTWDLLGIGLYQKVAFEDSNGWYLTVYDMEMGCGTVSSLSAYNVPGVTGKVYFTSDTTPPLDRGVIVVEESTNPEIEPGIYICFNAQKETWIKRVLFNRSCVWLAPGALSTIDMPLSVNWALNILHGLPPSPLKPMIESVTESLNNLDNKVDKETGKGLSEVNFTKTYENQVKNISNLESRISNLEYYHSSNYMDQEAMVQSAIMIANEIAANPRGAYLNTQELLAEYAKLMSGQTSDKVFTVSGFEVFFMKLSDKTPAKEDFTKGFSTAMAYPDEVEGLMILRPAMGLMMPDIALYPDMWENFIGDSSLFTDLDGVGSFIFSDAFVVAQEGNSMGLPKGLYVPGSFDMLFLGLQINGFDLSSSTAPVSRAQIEDILLFIEESMITFTVNGVPHRAIKGMTWSEWVNSRYNDTELTVVTHWQAGQMIGISSTHLLRPYSYVRPDELIKAEEYSLGYEISEPV